MGMERFAKRHRHTLNELQGTDFGKSPSDSTLQGSIAENASGAARFIAQVTLYSQSLGVVIAQTTYAIDASGEIQALPQLLEAATGC